MILPAAGLILETPCTNCHGLEGQGGWGPDLAGRRITYDQAIAAIRNPAWRMPAFAPSQLSDKEVQDMVAYWNTLPVAPAIGKWRNEAPADGPRAQQLAVNIIGCGQCHGVTMSTPRHGAAAMNADFEWFKRQVYNHATAMPEQWKHSMGRGVNHARARADGQFLAEGVTGALQDLTWMNDLGRWRIATSGSARDRGDHCLHRRERGAQGQGCGRGGRHHLLSCRRARNGVSDRTGYEALSGREGDRRGPSGACELAAA